MGNGYFLTNSNILDRERRRQEQFAFFIYLLYLFYFLSPICTQIVPKILRYSLYGVIILYSIHIQIVTGGYIKKEAFFFITTEFLFILTLYYGKWAGTQTLLNYGFGVFLFWVPLLLFESVTELPDQSRKKLKNIFWILIATVVTTTIMGNIQYAGASRYLAGSTSNAAFYKLRNIGDYQLVYGTVLLVPYILYELSNKGRFGKSIFLTMLLVAIFLQAIVTQYATSIIIYVIEILIVVATTAKNKTTMLIKCFVLVAVFFLIKNSIPRWLLSVRDFFIETDSAWLAERCELLVEFISGKGASGDMADRGSLYLKSWQAFCQSPWIGKLAGTQSEIGGHSEVLDILGATGIVGFSLFGICLARFIKQVLSHTKKNIRYVFASLVGFVILASINTALFPIIGIMEFMSLPIVINKD